MSGTIDRNAPMLPGPYLRGGRDRILTPPSGGVITPLNPKTGLKCLVPGTTGVNGGRARPFDSRAGENNVVAENRGPCVG